MREVASVVAMAVVEVLMEVVKMLEVMQLVDVVVANVSASVEVRVLYTHPGCGPAAGAEDAVGEVGPATAVQRFAPLQGD